MSGRYSRNKGKRGERQVVHLFKEHGFEARRGDSQSRGAREADVEDVPMLWIEVKIGKPRIRQAIEQAERDTDGRIPVVFWKDDRKDWRVDVDASTFLRMLGACRTQIPVLLSEPKEDTDGDKSADGKRDCRAKGAGCGAGKGCKGREACAVSG